MKEKEILYFSLISAFFLIILGYCTGGLISGGVNSNLTLSINYSQDNPGIMFFFLNNIKFFISISFLPFINLYFYIIQFISIGINISEIISLPFKFQFYILYRHLFFEVIAIMISIILSYRYIIDAKKLLNDIKIDWKKEGKMVAGAYLFILICTIIAAVLEGTANVAS